MANIAIIYRTINYNNIVQKNYGNDDYQDAERIDIATHEHVAYMKQNDGESVHDFAERVRAKITENCSMTYRYDFDIIEFWS
jgi:hypothetical protein